MTTVRVEAPARLHMGMLDASGAGTRRFGGLGVAVDRPAVVVEAIPSDELTVEGAEVERARAVAERCRAALGLTTGARVRVLEAIPSHVGLGSGTKLALAVTAALSALAERSPDPAGTARHDAPAMARMAGRSPDAGAAAPDPVAMARMAGRGARSAVGLWTFALGGLVVEGGVHRENAQAAPLLVRHAMPDEWRCVLAIPTAEPGLSGGAEAAAFARLRPDPDRSALISQIVLTTLLPALVERDLVEFGAALTRLQRLVGDSFAPVQGGTFHPQAGALVEALLRHGAAGAGQSSWGPAVYGVVGSEGEGHELARRLESDLGAGGRAEVVAFDNRGARVKEVA
jgi:beta-ribofuranosylaminobenzene 5'-phosphate synthase